jgi:lactobin A/cerein 7B family class IIb bacteriocin
MTDTNHMDTLGDLDLAQASGGIAPVVAIAVAAAAGAGLGMWAKKIYNAVTSDSSPEE